jgi:hypothetical protein
VFAAAALVSDAMSTKYLVERRGRYRVLAAAGSPDGSRDRNPRPVLMTAVGGQQTQTSDFVTSATLD